MKKTKLLLFCLLIFILQGCMINDPQYINFSSKPTTDYYTKDLYSLILKNNPFKLEVFDTEFYKSYEINNEHKNIIENFLKELTSKNFLEEAPKERKEKEPYRMIITFKTTKYIISVYNHDTVLLFPWDGKYNEDYITMEGVPLHYNLMDFCEYVKSEGLKK